MVGARRRIFLRRPLPGVRAARAPRPSGDYHRGVATFEHTLLSNGTRVLTAPMSHAQSVSCFVMFAAGSRYERRKESGIAHFAEHMFFKGTERRPTARDIATEIDSIGGEFNAFTGKELTGYYVKCAAETRDVALDVLVDMLRNSRFDADEIEREKGVIVEEMNMYADTPRSYVGNVWERHLYGDQPLGWDIIGTEETVRGATRETFLEYIDRWYRPERTVVGLGGKIGDDLIERLEELLGPVGAASTGAPDVVVLPENGSPVRIHTKQSDQAHIVVGARSYPHGHPDRYVVQLLSTVLGGGMSSRLFTEVRERRGLAYYVYCANNSYADAGTLAAQAGVDLTRIDEAVETSPPSCAASSPSRCRPRSSRRRARSRRAASSSASRAPTRRSCSASGVSCSRAARWSRRRSSQGSTRSPETTSNVSRRTSSAAGCAWP